MSMNIYNASPINIEIIEMNKLNEHYNKMDDITEKTNEEIEKVQNENKEEPKRFLKKLFSISFSKRGLFFKPRMSDWGTVDLNIPLNDDELKDILSFGDNFKNYLFNYNMHLTDKMPECIEMGINDSLMKHKLKFRESMPEYSYNEEDLSDERYHRYFNMITIKKSEKYGISSTMTANIQQISLLKDIFNNEFPVYFEEKAQMKKLINENNKYLVSDFKFLTKDGGKDKSYDYKKFILIKKLYMDIEQDLDDDIKESKIKELEKEISEFDANHYTYERFMTYMSKRKKNMILGLEMSPCKLMLSYNKFEKLYKQNPLYPIEEYLDGNVYYNKIEEFIVSKKETDREGKVSISKSKKSRYDFYMKLIVFDETTDEKKEVVTKRPDYFSRSDDKTASKVEVKTEEKVRDEVEEVDLEVPDSDED